MWCCKYKIEFLREVVNFLISYHILVASYVLYTLHNCNWLDAHNRAVYRIFAKGGRIWSMSKRGGARLFVAAGQPQGGGCRRGMCPLPHKFFTYLRSIYEL